MEKVALILALLLAGCATEPPNHWESVKVDSTPTLEPLALPELPLPVSQTENTVTLDKAGAERIREYRIVAESNTEMAEEYAKSIDQRKRATEALVEAGKAQREIAEMRKEMLEDERRHNFFSSIGYWVVIIGLGLAL